VYLLPFEAAIKVGGMASIMNGYHELDGVPCGASQWLFRDLLRGEWGFDGLVVADYFAIRMLMEHHHLAATKAEAARIAVETGIDVDLPGTDCYGTPLREALLSGAVYESQIDELAGRVLAMKFRMGLFEQPFVEPERAAEVFDTPAQRELAREIAQKSIVLLKNEGGLLPLPKDLASIAVIGPNADNVRHQLSDYSYPAHIETLLELLEQPGQLPQTLPEQVELADIGVELVGVLDAIRRAVGPDTQVHFAKGCDVLSDSEEGFEEAIVAAREAQVAIVVVGDKAGLTDSCSSGESRDRAELGLPGVQEQLVRAVAATGTPTVVVLMSGRPPAIPWIARHIPALLEVWLPGEEGGNAVADVLFGDANPGGRLPISVPRAVGQLPVFYNHKPSGGRSHWKGDYVELSTKPLYPFGYGLSYTSFSYANLCIGSQEVAPTGRVAISFEIANTGERTGDEVVQVYVRDTLASVTRPVKELKGFARVTLEPGEKHTVTFELDARQLGFYDQRMRFVVEPGAIEIMVGSSSEDIRLRGSFAIAGTTADVGQEKVF
ncbi:MAG TPA: glycoside hydrolase family 3 C-terminal domain-containing protein, partial [Roseiflexaceae bacterium]|nr:glycoside hydrolase family 3 C-terminal domain-containing protein [Roseiflexaceae bacterium]